MVKKRKLLLLSDSLRATTGNSRVARGLLKGLKKLGYTVGSISLGPDEPEGELDGIKILPITQRGFDDDSVQQFMYKLTLYLEREKPDYFIFLGDAVHFQSLNVGAISKEFLKGIGTKMIFWETCDSDVRICMENHYKRVVNPRIQIYKACDYVVTTSEHGKKVLEHEFINVDKVIWEFVDTDEFIPVSKDKKIELRKEYHFRKDDFIFFSSGRCMRRKGHELMIEALYPLLCEYEHARLFCLIPDFDKNDELNLIDFIKRVMVSRDEYGNRDLINEQKISFCTVDKKPIRLTVGIDDKEVVKFHQLSDAMIMGTMNEGFNLNFGESMSVGNPYVGSNNTTIPELTNDGEVGFIAPIMYQAHLGQGLYLGNTTVDELRKQAKKVLDLSEKEMDELRITNRKFIENQMPRGKCISSWYKFLKEIEGDE